MPQVALATAAILIALGVFGYLGGDPDHRSPTSLIPAFVGLAIGLPGLLAFKAAWRKHAMHAAVTVGLLGALAGWGRFASTLGNPAANSRAGLFVLGMAVICTVFVILCVRSFIAARKRAAANPKS